MSSTFQWTCKGCNATNHYNIECNGCKAAAPNDYRDKVIANAKDILSQHDQSHVLAYIDSIVSNSDLNRLLLQIYSIDCTQINNLYKRAMTEEKSRKDADEAKGDDDNKAAAAALSPFPHTDAFNINTIGDVDKLCNIGYKAISESKCCVIIMAGGQGTRLGFPKPKGCYEIGPVSNKSIYQLHIEKMSYVKNAACKAMNTTPDKVYFPVYFMTSEATNDETQTFLDANKAFGYSDVQLFKQQLFPCLNEQTGKFIMKSPSEIAMSPNGNGGIYSSLTSTGVFKDMCAAGIEYIQIFGIDNILARVGDPLWFGHMIESGADASNKTCVKKDPFEKVGVMCLKDARPAVVEYTELTKDMVELEQKDSKELEYCYGNLCMHMFSMQFITKICEVKDDTSAYALPIHVARKQIPYYDVDQKQTVKPKDKNGIKLEFFVFDTYQYSQKCTVYNILRSEEFAPVKNKDSVGKDSPLTARIAHSNYWKNEVVRNGGKFVNDDWENDEVFCEVSPLFGYAQYGDGGAFKKSVEGNTFKLPYYFSS